MSIWDNVKKFAQPYNDDEYDEYDDEEEYMDDYEEEEEKPRRSRASRSSRRSAPARDREPEREPERQRENAPAQEFDDDYEDAFNSIPKSAPSPAAGAAPSASGGFSGRVVNMNKKDVKDNIVLFRPTSYNDATDAGNELKQNHPVIVNLEEVDSKVARRVVDFLSGCVFAADGSVKKIAKSVYLFCPNNVEVSDKLGDLGAEVEQLV